MAWTKRTATKDGEPRYKTYLVRPQWVAAVEDVL